MKRMLVFLLVAAFLLFVAGCKSSSHAFQDPDYEPLRLTTGLTHSDYPGVTVQIDSLNDHGDKIELVVVWDNNTDYDVIYGAPYSIERLDGEEWVSCATQEELSFIEVAYELQSGKSQNETYNLTNTFDVSRPGTYRFKTECFVHTGSDIQDTTELWAEFTVGNVKCPDDSKEAGTSLEYCAQYIRTNGYIDGAEFPRVCIIRSLQDLNDYYTTYHEIFDLERKEKVYSDTTIGFLDACDQYDASFFEKNFLVFVLLEESSGSIRHEVQRVEQNPDKQILVSIDRAVPDAGTDDMAEWHIILELSRNAEVATERDVLVYLDEELAWNGDVVIQPNISYAGSEFTKPPAAMLVHSDGSEPIRLGGYSWHCNNSDGTATAVIADQTGRIPGKDVLPPVYVKGDYVKLDFEDTPDSVEITCWPDKVWDNEDTPSQSVNAYDIAFDVKPGGFIYEILATWNDDGSSHHGTANYYVYIVAGEDHAHSIAAEAQTVDDPFTGYCGNTQTTLYIGDRATR